MEASRTFLAVLFLGVIALSLAEDDKNSNSNSGDMMEEDTSVERKKNDGMEQMYMMVMMFKAFLQTIISFVSPIIQIKSFGLSVIGTIINLVRLVMMLKQQQQQGMPAAAGGMSWDNNRRYVTLAPHLHSLYYPNYNSDERV